MRRIYRGMGALALLVASLLSAGCIDGIAQHKAEDEIAKLLPQYLGPADSYKVNVDGSASQLMHGHLKGVTIQGVNVRPQALPAMTRLEASVQDLDVDLKAYKILRSGPACFTGWVPNGELTRMVQGKFAHLEDVKISSGKGILSAAGKVTYLGLGVNGQVDATASVRQGTQIWMTPVKVQSLGVGVGLPVWGRTKLMEMVNPVYTVPASPLKIRLTSLQAEPGQLKISGTLDPLGLNTPPKNTQSAFRPE